MLFGEQRLSTSILGRNMYTKWTKYTDKNKSTFRYLGYWINRLLGQKASDEILIKVIKVKGTYS